MARSLALVAPRWPGLCQAKGAQWPACIIIVLIQRPERQKPLQLPTGTGHAVLETSVSCTRQSRIASPSATESLIAAALYRWEHVTSLLSKGSLFSSCTCTFSLLPSPPVPILLPAPPLSMSHMAQRGVEKSSVNLCLLWCCLHATGSPKIFPLQ